MIDRTCYAPSRWARIRGGASARRADRFSHRDGLPVPGARPTPRGLRVPTLPRALMADGLSHPYGPRVALVISDVAELFHNAGGSLYLFTVRRFYNEYKHKQQTLPPKSGLDFSRYRSVPAALLVAHYALMVHELLVSDAALF